MRKLQYLLSAGAIFMFLFTVSCGSDDSPASPKEEKTQQLTTSAWVATSVSDGTNRSDYTTDPAYTISFTSSAYTTSNGPDLVPIKPSGNWSFTDDNATNIKLGDLTTSSFELTDNTLKLTFSYSGPGYSNAKTESVEGTWNMTFQKAE